MSRLVLFLTVVLTLAVSRPAAADLLIAIDRATQRMTVFDNTTVYMWPVSTGAPGYATPAGSFRPSRMEVEHYSREWDDAPMPHSIFFTDAGHAIHGTSHIGSLGAPASHGCVRVAPEHAAYLFNLVEAHGLDETRIEISGSNMQVSDNFERDTYEPFPVDLGREVDRQVKRWIQVLEGIARR
jgi:lipoprotein-anchoring transpeptidase ErfK/SrfK